jgi:hypothetical protein
VRSSKHSEAHPLHWYHTATWLLIRSTHAVSTSGRHGGKICCKHLVCQFQHRKLLPQGWEVNRLVLHASSILYAPELPCAAFTCFEPSFHSTLLSLNYMCPLTRPHLHPCLSYTSTLLADAIGSIHLLPIFPSTGDRGFAPVNYQEVDPKLGERYCRRHSTHFVPASCCACICCQTPVSHRW